MSGRELFTTTMDPANRELIQLTTEDIQETLDLYNTCFLIQNDNCRF